MTLQKQLIFITTILLLITFSACNMNAIYDENVKINESQWIENEAVNFKVDISDTLAHYDFYINLRNSTDYNYQNLYIFLTTFFPNDNITCDTIEFMLADQGGKWLGKGWGSLKENDILLKSNLTFPLSGEYKFVIQHAMREDTLSGISNIGVRIEKSK